MSDDNKEKEQAIVSCGTSAGPIVMQFTRQWSPLGYDRVVELFERAFYDHSHFYRVAPHFLVQFGISYTDDHDLKALARRPIDDDPPLDPPMAFDTGMISFAGSGPNSRGSQIFIAYGPNKGLGRELWETPVGRVISGMEHAERFYSYGDMPPWGHGPLQNKIHNGREYIDTEFPLLDSFETCTVERIVTGFVNSRAAEVQAAVADAAQEAAVAAEAAHGGLQGEPDTYQKFQQEEQPGQAAGTIRTPISLSSMKAAAEKMRHFHRDDADYAETALVLACIVTGCMVAAWITTKLFGRSSSSSKKAALRKSS